MAAYNAERFLAASLDSVLAQTHREFELLVIDDGSTDGTAAILDAYGARDTRLRLIHQRNRGCSASLNRGLAEAKTELVARLDADDLMFPDRLNRQIAFMEAHPEVAAAGSFVRLINAKDQVIGQYRSPFHKPDRVRADAAAGRLVHLHHPSVMMRRTVALAVGGYRNFEPSEDVDLWTRMLECGHMVLVQPEFLVSYRIHARSLSVSQAALQHQRTAWVQDCMRMRRSGRLERDWESFLTETRTEPLLWRIMEARRLYGSIFYKQAVIAYASGEKLRVGMALIPALVLAPAVVARQLCTKSTLAARVRNALSRRNKTVTASPLSMP